MSHAMQDAMQDEEFEMLLNRVLRTVANPEPAETLREKVMLRLRMAQVEEQALVPKPVVPDAVFHALPESESIFASLWSGVRDLVAPKRVPPLELQSRPVAVADRMAARRGAGSTVFAIGLHLAAILLIVFLVGSRLRTAAPLTKDATLLELTPPPMLPQARRIGGGGGQRGPAPASKGTPPKFSAQQIVPPKAPPLISPKLAVIPTIDVQQNLKMASAMPNIGMVNAPAVGVSMGNGNGSGLGSGDGNGMGPGSGGNTGGGVRQVGGGVSAPIEIYRVEPEFSEEARKAKLSGNVLLNLWVDRGGAVTHVRVLKGLGMGLDEKAVEAVKQFRFKPAMENGKPVTVEMNIEVSFEIF